MTYFRLVKPTWGKSHIKDQPNPNFVKTIKGPNIFEGCFSEDYLQEKNKEGYNIYFFPNHPSSNIYNNTKKFLSGRDIDVFNFVFVDMDLKDKIYETKEDFYKKLKEFPIKPTFVVDSGNGVHAYWNVNNLTRELYIITQLQLITYFKTDESVWTVLQLMRYPGSNNTKDSNNFKLASIQDSISSGNSYGIEEFLAILPELTEVQKVKMQNHLNKLDGKTLVQLSENINIDEIPDSFIDLMYEDNLIYQLFTNPKEFYGDRSAADMKLTNLLYNKGMSKNDALAVIANTQKGTSKGNHRFDYASGTVDKAYVDRTKHKFLTVDQKLRQGISLKSGEPVFGPGFMDCLVGKWCKKQVLGLIAGPGVGKTTVTLYAFKEMIKNNPDNDDVFVFISLEMPEEDIIEKWVALVGRDSDLTKRLYVISNEDENGDPRNIGIQEVHEYVEDIKKATGRNVASVAIDHIGVLSTVIDMKKKYKFGIEQESKQYDDNIRTLSLNNLCTQMKVLAKMLDTFLIVLTQTTKSKGVGDTPIEKDGAYGISQYENIMDYIITIWQPLMRIQSCTELYFLSWQYAKIRKKHRNDKVQTNQHKLLIYELDTGELSAPTESEYRTFMDLLPQAIEARKQADEKKCTSYSRSLSAGELQKLAEKLKQ